MKEIFFGVILRCFLVTYFLHSYAISLAQEAGWEQEIWSDIPGKFLNDLIVEPRYYEKADRVEVVNSSVKNSEKYYGSRVRGLITIPEDGFYTFWLSASEQGAFYLSKNGTKWGRELFASTPRRVGVNNFDYSPEQQSQEVSLMAGDKVFVEVLSKGERKGGHVGLAWSYENGQVNWTQQDGVVAEQSSTELGATADRAIDGNRSGHFGNESVAMTRGFRAGWWTVDLGAERPVDALVLWNLEDTYNRLSNFRLVAYGGSGEEIWSKSFYENGGRVESRLRVELSEEMGEIPMVRSIKVEALGRNQQNTYYLALAEVEVLGPALQEESIYQPREMVPSNYLVSYLGEDDDEDNDELNDVWESQYGFDLESTEVGDLSGGSDPDHDGWTNVEEAFNGSNPFSADSLSGVLSLERWRQFPYTEVEQTVADSKFYHQPDETGWLYGAETGAVFDRYSATRVRGYLEAPVTGEYHFWVSGREGVRLSLSSVSGSKYHKQKIAFLSQTSGSGLGVGVGLMSLNRWDTYITQVSDPVHLEAGERYYLEAIQQRGAHGSRGELGIAWAYSGQEREVIPAEYLYNYHVTQDDSDDDFLPDQWEVEYGLNPEDNGAGDLERQGERGDYDQDGLTNRQEYLLGTSPSSTDSDGDGLSDYDEVTFYGTAPDVSNALSSTVLEEVDLADHQATARWEDLKGGLIADSFRGKIAWNFTVPSDGWWVLDLSARLLGDLRAEEDFPIRLAVDDSQLGLKMMRFRYSEPKSIKFLTPYLTSGTHQLTLTLDNYVGRRTMQILGLQVLQTGGLDADENGVADWLEAEGIAGNRIATHANTSLVSPAFIEGSSRYSNQARVLVGEDEVVALSGLGPQHWYANVPLFPSGVTPIEVGFEQGQVVEQTGIEWVAWDVESGEVPRVRAGDSLKLTLAEGGVIRINSRSMPRMVVRLDAGEERIFRFPYGEVYVFTVVPKGGNRKKFKLTASTASLETLPGFFVSDLIATVSFPGVAPDLMLNSGSALEIVSQGQEGAKQRVQAKLLARETGALPIAVRLYENGPIVVSGVLNAINYSDALRNDAQMFVGYTEDGARVLRTPIVLTGLPPGGYIKVSIHRSGVTFLDGTRTMILNESDFNNGVAFLDFRYPAGMRGGYCHYISIYDGSGNLVVTR